MYFVTTEVTDQMLTLNTVLPIKLEVRIPTP